LARRASCLARASAEDVHYQCAYAAFEESDKGSIDVGKLADFTVLSADIMKIPALEILKTRCEMTVIGGEIVYGDR
jgi:predicted amidohydrolase YtcJ